MRTNTIYNFLKSKQRCLKTKHQKNKEHQKTQVSSLKEEHKAATATTYSKPAIYRSILGVDDPRILEL